MSIFNPQSQGVLGKASKWMTPERAIAMQGIGMGFSQMSMGQPVNMSPAHKALAARQQRQQQEQALKDSGLMDKFSPDERAILAQMEPGAAQKIIASKIFAAPAAPQVINGQLVAADGSVIGDYRTPEAGPDPTTAQRDYTFYRDQAVGAGQQPMSFFEWQTAKTAAGASNVTVNGDTMPLPVPEYSKLPAGYVYKRDAQGQIELQDGIPIAVPVIGGPKDTSASDEVKAGNKEIAGNTVMTAAQRARDAAGKRVATGLAGAAASFNPSSNNAEVYRQVDVLRSNAKVENLNAMRAASPTGGALGSVTEGELKMLADKSGALDPASPNFLRDLDDYEMTMLRIIHGAEAGEAIYQETRETVTPSTGGVDLSTATREQLGSFDLSNATAAEMDAWEARMKELGL